MIYLGRMTKDFISFAQVCRCGELAHDQAGPRGRHTVRIKLSLLLSPRLRIFIYSQVPSWASK
jgi:hypothetical protein